MLLLGNSGGCRFGVAPVLPRTEHEASQHMTAERITKRTVDALRANESEFTVWDNAVTGFGVRVRPTGAKSYGSLQGRRGTRGACAPLHHRGGRENSRQI